MFSIQGAGRKTHRLAEWVEFNSARFFILEAKPPDVIDRLTSNSVQDPTRFSENSVATSWFTQLFDRRLNVSERVQQPRLARELARRIVEEGYPEPRQLPSLARQKW